VGNTSLNRNNGLYLIIGALIVVIIGLGAYIFHEESKPDGVEMSIGKNGVTIQENCGLKVGFGESGELVSVLHTLPVELDDGCAQALCLGRLSADASFFAYRVEDIGKQIEVV
jgi:hypothetical protein